jgi:hypothetical protein
LEVSHRPDSRTGDNFMSNGIDLRQPSVLPGEITPPDIVSGATLREQEGPTLNCFMAHSTTNQAKIASTRLATNTAGTKTPQHQGAWPAASDVRNGIDSACCISIHRSVEKAEVAARWPARSSSQPGAGANARWLGPPGGLLTSFSFQAKSTACWLPASPHRGPYWKFLVASVSRTPTGGRSHISTAARIPTRGTRPTCSLSTMRVAWRRSSRNWDRLEIGN